ncbi:hypothetical protein DXG01_010746, partial [Tephrocybe rancida]
HDFWKLIRGNAVLTGPIVEALIQEAASTSPLTSITIVSQTRAMVPIRHFIVDTLGFTLDLPPQPEPEINDGFVIDWEGEEPLPKPAIVYVPSRYSRGDLEILFEEVYMRENVYDCLDSSFLGVVSQYSIIFSTPFVEPFNQLGHSVPHMESHTYLYNDDVKVANTRAFCTYLC